MLSIDEEGLWTEDELRVAVEAYLDMLRLENGGIEYSKAEYNRRLRSGPLSARSESAVEYRMQNISSVLAGMGRSRIDGYRPAANVGPANEARLRALIASVEASIKTPPGFSDICSTPDSLMGVKAVFGELSSHVLCFGGRGTINDRSYFSVAASAARRAVERPYVVTIGAGENVRPGLDGRVLNLARVSLVYGPTGLFVTDPAEVARLAQWPVAVVLHDAWRIGGLPHLVEELGFLDRTILAGAQDGIVRPDIKVDALWQALKDKPLELLALPLPANFYDPGKPTLAVSKLPLIPKSLGAQEGEKVWKLQLKLERDPAIAREGKARNAARYGSPTCEACDFSHTDQAMFDAHHPTPLAIGVRVTLPEHLQILCPTCHRRAHRKSRLEPYTLLELRNWNAAGRP